MDSILFTLRIKEPLRPNDVSWDCTNWHLWISKDACHLERHVSFLSVAGWQQPDPVSMEIDTRQAGGRAVIGCVISLFQIRCLNLLPSLCPSETSFPGNRTKDPRMPPYKS